MNKRVLMILADGFEEIEAIAVIDILRRCSIEVRTASLSGQTLVAGGHQIIVQADVLLKDIRADFDACILPGGSAGAQRLADSDIVHSLISVMHQANKIIAAICAAPAKVLSPAGLLDGRKATCYPGMQNLFPSSATYLEDPVVIDGNIITSRGAGTALEFAFTLAEQLVGKKVIHEVRVKMVAG